MKSKKHMQFSDSRYSHCKDCARCTFKSHLKLIMDTFLADSSKQRAAARTARPATGLFHSPTPLTVVRLTASKSRCADRRAVQPRPPTPACRALGARAVSATAVSLTLRQNESNPSISEDIAAGFSGAQSCKK